MHTSVLEYSRLAGVDSLRPSIVALHGEATDHHQLLPLLESVERHGGVVAPKAGRWSGWSVDGQCYSWFQALETPAVEPIAFGDALCQLESFMRDVALPGLCAAADRSESVDVVGVGQGAALGFALAALWPEWFDRVISIDGYWPEVKGWQPARRSMDGVCVTLLYRDLDGPGPAVARRTASELYARRASVDTCKALEAPGDALMGVSEQVAAILAGPTRRMRCRTSSERE